MANSYECWRCGNVYDASASAVEHTTLYCSKECEELDTEDMGHLAPLAQDLETEHRAPPTGAQTIQGLPLLNMLHPYNVTKDSTKK